VLSLGKRLAWPEEAKAFGSGAEFGGCWHFCRRLRPEDVVLATIDDRGVDIPCDAGEATLSKRVSRCPCPQAKSVLMIHFKGDQRTLYDDCQRFVNALPVKDKARSDQDWTFLSKIPEHTHLCLSACLSVCDAHVGKRTRT